jgi:uncharacterized membrane protein SirB2
MFISLIFKKTNVNEPYTVILTCDTTAMWFEKIEETKGFPSNFNFSFFLKGIEIMLDLDHSVVTSKCIWLLFKIFHVLPIDE